MPVRPINRPPDGEPPRKKLEPLDLDAGAVKRPDIKSLDAGAVARKADAPPAPATPAKRPEPNLDAGDAFRKPESRREGEVVKVPAKPPAPSAGGSAVASPVSGGAHKMPPVTQLRGRPLGRILIKMGKLT